MRHFALCEIYFISWNEMQNYSRCERIHDWCLILQINLKLYIQYMIIYCHWQYPAFSECQWKQSIVYLCDINTIFFILSFWRRNHCREVLIPHSWQSLHPFSGHWWVSSSLLLPRPIAVTSYLCHHIYKQATFKYPERWIRKKTELSFHVYTNLM